MKINNNSDQSELEIYLKIIDYFQNKTIGSENKEIWKNHSIIELMKLLERTKNRTFVANALIMIISLFENIPPDLYSNRGINIDSISEKDKKSLLTRLRNEFLPN